MNAGQEHAIQAFDQQLNAMTQQIKWSRPDIFEPHILRLGGYHSLSTFISALSKMWADGGLLDLFVDSGVYAGYRVEQNFYVDRKTIQQGGWVIIFLTFYI